MTSPESERQTERELAPHDLDALAQQANPSDADFEDNPPTLPEPTNGSRRGLGIAIALLSIYGVAVLLSLIAAFLDATLRREIVTLIVATQTTLVGTALGFYFGREP